MFPAVATLGDAVVRMVRPADVNERAMRTRECGT
jgi:hypothetical protein